MEAHIITRLPRPFSDPLRAPRRGRVRRRGPRGGAGRVRRPGARDLRLRGPGSPARYVVFRVLGDVGRSVTSFLCVWVGVRRRSEAKCS